VAEVVPVLRVEEGHPQRGGAMTDKPHIYMRDGRWCVGTTLGGDIWMPSLREAMVLAWKIHVVQTERLQ